MARANFEIFGLLEYDEELTFEQVQEIEEELKDKLKTIFAQAGSKQANILEIADGLQIHLTLQDTSEANLSKMCSKIKALLSEDFSFKLLFVDKTNMNWISYFITHESIKKKKFAF